MKKNERRDNFDALHQEIKDEFRRKIDALYTLYPEFHPSRVVTPGGEAPAPQNLSAAIRRVIAAHATEKISVESVAGWLTELEPTVKQDRTPISNTLARLARKGELTPLTEPGVRPASYSVKKRTPAPSVNKELTDLDKLLQDF